MQSDAIAKSIGQTVRTERERQGLRQDELALAAGVSPRTVFHVEHAKPTSRLDVVTKILEALGLTLRVVESSRTLASAPPGATRFEIYRDGSGAYRWRLRAANGEILATSEAFVHRESAVRAARIAASAEIVEA